MLTSVEKRVLEEENLNVMITGDFKAHNVETLAFKLHKRFF
jgi:hypothetical protein